MKTTGAFRFLVALVIACTAGMIIIMLLEAVFTPWARSLKGGATLTGEWVGELIAPTRTKHTVWLEIRLAADCQNCPRIDGRIATCRDAGHVRQYEAWGDVENWRGTRFLLKTREVNGVETEPRLGILQGNWDGQEVRLTTRLMVPDEATTTRWERNEAGEERTTIVGGNPDARTPIVFSLQRGSHSDFLKSCAGRQWIQ